MSPVSGLWFPWHIYMRFDLGTLDSGERSLPLGYLLAHLSWRLTRWAYSKPMVRLLSVVVHTFKLEYLWSQLVNLDQILCIASLGWGKGCIRFWGRLDQNSGFHGNRIPPLTYNVENDVSTFFLLVFDLIHFILAGNKDVHKSQIGPLPTEKAALECLKNFP